MPATLFDTPALQELLRQDIIRVCRLEDKEVRERVDALARRRVDEQQRLHEIIFGAVGELALDSDNMDNSERAQRAAEAALYPDLQPGTYVRYYVGDRPPEDEGPRWSAVHRIVRRLHGVAVVLARADDPLRQCTQSCMRVRKVEVHDDEREQFDKLAAETEEQVQQQLQLRQQHTWTQTDDGDIEWHIEDIVEARQRAGRRELLVRWANGEETWEGDAHLRREVPHLVHRFTLAQRRDARANDARAQPDGPRRSPSAVNGADNDAPVDMAPPTRRRTASQGADAGQDARTRPAASQPASRSGAAMSTRNPQDRAERARARARASSQ